MTDALHNLTGLPYLTEAVARFMHGTGLDVLVEMGWKAPDKVNNQAGQTRANRIVVRPGTEDGDAGALVGAVAPGLGYRAKFPMSGPGHQNVNDEQARPLSTWDEIATVYIWAVDRSAINDAKAQYIAVRNLLQVFRRALQYATLKDSDVGALKWRAADAQEQLFGQELVLAIRYRSPLLDTQQELVHPTKPVVIPEFSTSP